MLWLKLQMMICFYRKCKQVFKGYRFILVTDGAAILTAYFLPVVCSAFIFPTFSNSYFHFQFQMKELYIYVHSMTYLLRNSDHLLKC